MTKEVKKRVYRKKKKVLPPETFMDLTVGDVIWCKTVSGELATGKITEFHRANEAATFVNEFTGMWTVTELSTVIDKPTAAHKRKFARALRKQQEK
jgi:hypothetical protein